MKTYFIKFSNREEGPYAETEVAQMYADGRIDRNTPCKPADRDADWKSIDDYLPMLKYGTPRPPATKVPAVPPVPPPISSSQLSQRISIVDFDIPFGSVLKIMFKWMADSSKIVRCSLAGDVLSVRQEPQATRLPLQFLRLASDQLAPEEEARAAVSVFLSFVPFQNRKWVRQHSREITSTR